MRSRLSILLLLFSIVFTNEVCAQRTGGIEGMAKDMLGRPVVGAIVEVYSGGVKKGGAATDEDGSYEIKYLPPGTFELVARYPEYKKFIKKEIAVERERNTWLDIYFTADTLHDVEIKPIRPCGNIDVRNGTYRGNK